MLSVDLRRTTVYVSGTRASSSPLLKTGSQVQVTNWSYQLRGHVIVAIMSVEKDTPGNKNSSKNSSKNSNKNSKNSNSDSSDDNSNKKKNGNKTINDGSHPERGDGEAGLTALSRPSLLASTTTSCPTRWMLTVLSELLGVAAAAGAAAAAAVGVVVVVMAAALLCSRLA